MSIEEYKQQLETVDPFATGSPPRGYSITEEGGFYVARWERFYLTIGIYYFRGFALMACVRHNSNNNEEE